MYLVLWIEHRNVNAKLFTDFCRAKDFTEELYERLDEDGFIAILPCLAYARSQRDSNSNLDSNSESQNSPAATSQPETGSGLEEGIV